VSAKPGRGRAHARAALAGNPSDGYRGAVLAVELHEFTAVAAARPAAGSVAEPALDLVEAAIHRFAREHAPAAEHSAVHWLSSIPRSVGLGGSSAIVIATLRALCDLHRVTLDPDELAMLALHIETEDLGLTAGPQDRVAQAYGGVTFMDFASEEPRYERLGLDRLPPLLLAWRPASAESSGVVHGELRGRYAAAEPEVLAAMRRLATAARRARDAVVEDDIAELRRCVDASFDLRRSILALDPRHVEMIELARAAGASANYTGSGGAIVCVCTNDSERLAVSEALAEAGCETARIGVQ
jgi:glucuronokinase